MLGRFATILLRANFNQIRRLLKRSQSHTTVQLNNGCNIPALGLGTWKSKPGEVFEAVRCAISVGYRHLDCAHVYENEKEVGRAIACKIEDGTICRDDLFITSKLWSTYHGDWCRVRGGMQKTLDDLCLPYVDLYLIHWPFSFTQTEELWPKANGKMALSTDYHFTRVWCHMENLQREGTTRMIGVSNFNSTQIDKLLGSATIWPVINQVECHPYLNQVNLSTHCRERSIAITAYGPLGAPDFVKAGTPGPLDDAVVKSIARKHNKTPAQILLRYQIQRGHIVIPKSVTPERIQQNFEVFDFCLCQHDMNVLLGLEKGSKIGRIYKFEDAQSHPEYPFPELLPKAK